MPEIVDEGQLYKGTASGKMYRIIAVAPDPSNGVMRAVALDLDSGEVHDRPADEFLGMHLDGTPMFEEITIPNLEGFPKYPEEKVLEEIQTRLNQGNDNTKIALANYDIPRLIRALRDERKEYAIFYALHRRYYKERCNLQDRLTKALETLGERNVKIAEQTVQLEELKKYKEKYDRLYSLCQKFSPVPTVNGQRVALS